MAGTRRTQAERRAETSRLLIDATILTIVEAGYTGVTVKEVCWRAGVSHGGLFGRFDTLADLVAATAEEVGRRRMEQLATGMEELPDYGDIGEVLARWRAVAHDPLNAVWLELTVAARTDSALRERLRAVRAAYSPLPRTDGATIPALRGLTPEQLSALDSLVSTFFDGDAIHTALRPLSDADAPRVELLAAVLRHYLDDRRDPA
ncbi:TetR/AcrR family transcriptional regulator [Nocardia sp. NPDC055321]